MVSSSRWDAAAAWESACTVISVVWSYTGFWVLEEWAYIQQELNARVEEAGGALTCSARHAARVLLESVLLILREKPTVRVKGSLKWVVRAR